MMIRKLVLEDSVYLEQLIYTIETNLNNLDWWLPIKKKARDHFFDSTWTVFYGAFDNNNLVAASGLFINPFEYGECANILGLDLNDTAEIGRCMVLPKYRGNNLMLFLNQKLLNEALFFKRTNIVATAHPDNIASNSSLVRLGMKIEKKIIKQDKYPRNLLKMEIN